MNKYSYSGPVLEYGKLVSDNFEAATYAPSEKKARSNMAYQYKKLTGRLARSTKIVLPGEIILEEETS